jgi:hypothetical protein
VQASPYVDEKSLIRLLEKLSAHTEFRTLNKGEKTSTESSYIHVERNRLPCMDGAMVKKWKIFPHTQSSGLSTKVKTSTKSSYM